MSRKECKPVSPLSQEADAFTPGSLTNSAPLSKQANYPSLALAASRAGKPLADQTTIRQQAHQTLGRCMSMSQSAEQLHCSLDDSVPKHCLKAKIAHTQVGQVRILLSCRLFKKLVARRRAFLELARQTLIWRLGRWCLRTKKKLHQSKGRPKLTYHNIP